MAARSAAQLSCTVPEWKDAQALERRRTLAALERELSRARARGEEWIGWIDAGCPALSEAEYEARGGQRGRSSRGARRQLSS